MVLIIGAGLSGLLTAYRLQQKGIPYTILEARSRVGGRIHTLSETNQAPVEMGATWLSDHHINLLDLLDELSIPYYKQHMDATVFYQPNATSPAQEVQIPPQAPSYRISGGTSYLIEVLYQKLVTSNVLLKQQVREIKFLNNEVLVMADSNFIGNTVVLALPPKLWAQKISFEPPLPSELIQTAHQTQTWMEDSIKVAITYPTPFWQEEQIPATLFSNVGPVTEFYDHCNHERTHYALCGFINSSLKSLPKAERRDRVLKQLIEVFGAKTKGFLHYEECVWSKEKYTFLPTDTPLFQHQNNGNPIFRRAIFENRLLIASSEAAAAFPGYMDGAVSSANATSVKIFKNQT